MQKREESRAYPPPAIACTNDCTLGQHRQLGGVCVDIPYLQAEKVNSKELGGITCQPPPAKFLTIFQNEKEGFHKNKMAVLEQKQTAQKKNIANTIRIHLRMENKWCKRINKIIASTILENS